MKELNGCRSNNPVKKHKAKSKKHKPSFKYFVKNSWPKVMISRDNVIYKKARDNAFREQSSSELRAEEKNVDYDVKRSNYDENDANFEEEHSVCLISSSSEIEENFDMGETFIKAEKSLETFDEPIRKDVDCASKESTVSQGGDCSKPVFVDLTTEKKKNVWKHSMLKRFRSVKKNTVNEKKSWSGKCIVENVLADSSSKSNCDRIEGPATALRGREPYSIPVQPNRSLPIRPAPTRSFQNRLQILPKFTAQNTVEIESVKSPPTSSSSDEVLQGTDLNSEKRTALNETVNSMDYVIPQISSVETLAVVERRKSNDADHEKDNSVQEYTKRRKSQEADSSQNKPGNSINEFLKNFCPNVNEGMQNECTNKCAASLSMMKEETSNKLVPPLRLKKIARMSKNESTEATDSQLTAELMQETNYKIIKDKTLEPSSSLTSTNTDDMFYETETDLASLNTDSHKLKYRRNKLKEKLSELRSKALELSKQMANESDSQRDTSLRQVMNRYEKQIENLSKLHSKLSAAIPSIEEAININDNSNVDNECRNMNLRKADGESTDNNTPVSSPGPPKLSPRSPIYYDDTTQEIPNSPPVLLKICLATSSSQETTEDLNISETKPWIMNVNLVKQSPVDSVQPDVVNENTSTLETLAKNISEQPNTTSSDTNNSNFCVNEIEVTDIVENKISTWEETNANDKLINELHRCHDVIQKPEEIKSQVFFNNGPVIKSVSAGVELPMERNRKETKSFARSDKQLPSSEGNTINSCKSNQPDSAYSKINDDTKNLQNITSSTGQPTQFNVPSSVLYPRFKPKLHQSHKTEDESTDSTPTTENPLITEQFPSLRNWLVRMSKKQTSTVKSNPISPRNLPFTTTDTKHIRIAEPVVPIVVSNANNDLMNATPQNPQGPQGTERWSYQRPLQHTTVPLTLAQPIATVPALRPATYTAIPMPQFYLNNYPVDPYSSPALNYHPAMFPYSSYPYQSRLHSNIPPGYHFPMQEILRPVPQVDKRLPLTGQEPVSIRYPPSSMNTLQHPNNSEYDRLRGSSAVNNVNIATSSRSLFPPPTSSHEALHREPSISYPPNNEFSGNRMMPNVVAAAAAAAVVAAASIDRQYDTLRYNGTDMLPPSSIANTINERPLDAPSTSKSAINQSNTVIRRQDNIEEIQRIRKYKKRQNAWHERLSTETSDDSEQTNSVIDNDSQLRNPATSMTYQMSSNPSSTYSPRKVPENELRNANTPYLQPVFCSPKTRLTLRCSSCGDTGPRYKCLGCGIVYYCNPRCQENHWYSHRRACPKRMPNLKMLVE